MKKLFLWFALFSANTAHLWAQNTLNVADFLALVQAQSPLSKIAALEPQRAAETQRIARGGYDPNVYTYFDNKFFKQKDYYDLLSGGVKIPLPIGEAKIGYEMNSGTYLNPENNTPVGGLGAVGVTIPLVQGLLTDERRTALKQANIGVDMASVAQKQLLVDLFCEAKKAYWDWAQAYEQAAIIGNTYTLAQNQLTAIQQGIAGGDRAAIEATEQALNTRQWQIEATNAAMRARAAQLYAAQFVGEATERAAFLQTKPITFAAAAALPFSFAENHADLQIDSMRLAGLAYSASDRLLPLQAYDLKSQNLVLEAKLKAEKLKPKLNLAYNALATQFDYTNTKYGQFYENYKFGVQFSYPIFSRAERGGLNLTKIKQTENDYAQAQKRAELATKIDLYINELANNLVQIGLYEQQVGDYTVLRDAENTRYELGDSNVFMRNTRNTKLLEASLKLTELKAKHFKYWAILEAICAE